MGKLRCCSAVLLALIAACIAAGFQPGSAAAADPPSSPADLSQQPSPSTGSDAAPSGPTADQVEAAVTAQVSAAVATAGQEATSIADDIGNSSASGIAAPAAAIASSASAAVTDAINSAAQDGTAAPSGGDTSGGGLPSPAPGGDSQGSLPPIAATPGAGTDQSPTPGAAQGAPQVQVTTAIVVPPLGVSPDPSPSVPVGPDAQAATPTAGSDRGTAPRKASAAPTAADSIRAPAPAPPNRVGGLVGGTQGAVTAQIPGRQAGDTTIKARAAPPKSVSPLQSLAHGSKVVAGILPHVLPHELPSVGVGRGLSGDSGLIMRIAKLLAVVYAGFLIVWFWATRVRWNGR